MLHNIIYKELILTCRKIISPTRARVSQKASEGNMVIKGKQPPPKTKQNKKQQTNNTHIKKKKPKAKR